MLKLVNETTTHYEIEEYDNEDITIATIKRHLISKEDLKALFQVINKPLKYEDIKCFTWIWDEVREEYLYITRKYGGELSHIAPYQIDDVRTYFADGRFYRYQPLEVKQ